MRNIDKIIKGCLDCPLCDMNDMSSGYNCRLVAYPNNHIKESKKYQPITPDWCPIKLNKDVFTISYNVNHALCECSNCGSMVKMISSGEFCPECYC